MTIKSTPQYEELIEALATLKELKISEHLQEVALQHLLGKAQRSLAPTTGGHHARQPAGGSNAGELRSFISSTNPKGAVAEIPALLYWAAQNEGLKKANEKDVIELYRRAGMRPPKDITQSFRDLCSKKYLRLEVPEGERGYVRLSRVGEDFVLHDLAPK